MNSSLILAPVSIGELFDKISILEIKESKIKGDKLKNVKNEIYELKNIVKKNNLTLKNELLEKLKDTNAKLWDIEDKLRLKERESKFDDEFINLARSVYFNNDKRASIKMEINLLFNSHIIEEKSYENYLNK